jgi:hypothetical protein
VLKRTPPTRNRQSDTPSDIERNTHLNHGPDLGTAALRGCIDMVKGSASVGKGADSVGEGAVSTSEGAVSAGNGSASSGESGIRAVVVVVGGDMVGDAGCGGGVIEDVGCCLASLDRGTGDAVRRFNGVGGKEPDVTLEPTEDAWQVHELIEQLPAKCCNKLSAHPRAENSV